MRFAASTHRRWLLAFCVTAMLLLLALDRPLRAQESPSPGPATTIPNVKDLGVIPQPGQPLNLGERMEKIQKVPGLASPPGAGGATASPQEGSSLEGSKPWYEQVGPPPGEPRPQ